jgi:predicted ArsR family transcriptional regulator
MILKDIQTYLAKYGKASLAELAIHFRADANALRPMLDRLIRKGRIRQRSEKKCGGCQSCAPESLEFYEWVKDK